MGQYGPSAGGGGAPNQGYIDNTFTDHVPDGFFVNIRHYNGGKFVTNISVLDGDLVYFQLAGNGSVDEQYQFALNPNESIVEIAGTYGVYVNSITIITSQGRTLGPFGSNGPNAYTYALGRGERFAGLWGRTGAWIDAIGVYTSSVDVPIGPPIPNQ